MPFDQLISLVNSVSENPFSNDLPPPKENESHCRVESLLPSRGKEYLVLFFSGNPLMDWLQGEGKKDRAVLLEK